MQRALVDLFPDDLHTQVEFATTLLIVGRVNEAREILTGVSIRCYLSGCCLISTILGTRCGPVGGFGPSILRLSTQGGTTLLLYNYITSTKLNAFCKLKVHDGELEKGVAWMKRAMESEEPGVESPVDMK